MEESWHGADAVPAQCSAAPVILGRAHLIVGKAHLCLGRRDMDLGIEGMRRRGLLWAAGVPHHPCPPISVLPHVLDEELQERPMPEGDKEG